MNSKSETQFPYIAQTAHDHEVVVPWCEQHFGEFGDRWYRYGTDIARGIVTTLPSFDHYRFVHSEDAVLFQLRWS